MRFVWVRKEERAPETAIKKGEHDQRERLKSVTDEGLREVENGGRE